MAFGAYWLTNGEAEYPIDAEASVLVSTESLAIAYGVNTVRRIQSSLPYDVKAYFTVTKIYEA